MKIFNVAARIVINTTIVVEAKSAEAAAFKVGGMPSQLLLSQLDLARQNNPDGFDVEVEIASANEKTEGF